MAFQVRIAHGGQRVQLWSEKQPGFYPVIHITGDTWACEFHTSDMVKPYRFPGTAAMIRTVDLMHPRRSSVEWMKEFCFLAQQAEVGGNPANSSRYIWLAPTTPGREGLEAEPWPREYAD